MSEGNSENNESDNHSSANTSLSGLTGYEEQLYNLRLLTNPNVKPPAIEPTTDHNHECCSTLMYETRIKNLNIELQNSLKLNEKYKNDLFDFEKKVQLQNHERINTLIVRNAQLEGRLEFANNQIEALLKQCQLLGNEHSNVSLQSQIDFLQNEVARSNRARSDLELEFGDVKRELQETKEENKSRTACIEKLKEKICEQHSDLQSIVQEKAKLENSLASAKNDLDWCQKSEKWYKDQLHACQMTKSKIAEENLQLRQTLVEESQKNDTFRLDEDKWKHRYEELFLTTEKTKEMLQRRIEQLEINLLTKKQTVETNTDIEKLRDYYEAVVQDLGEEMIKIKQEIARQNEAFQNVTKENSALLARATTLQKNLNDREFLVERLETAKNDLQNKLSLNTQSLQDTKKQTVDLQLEKQELEVKLVASLQEKREIENTVTVIRNDFNKVVTMHKKLKNELHEKDKQILQLQSEKQSLFMSNNWQVCEMEQLKNNLSKIKVLENALQNFHIKEAELMQKNQVLLDENNNCNIKNKSLKETIDFLQQTVLEMEHKLKEVSTEKQMIVTQNEAIDKQLKEKETKLKQLSKDVCDRDEEILQLKTDIEELSNNCHILSTTKETLEQNSLMQTEELKECVTNKENNIIKLKEDIKILKNTEQNLNIKNEELQLNISILKQQLLNFTANNNNNSTKNNELNNSNNFFTEILTWLFKKIVQLEKGTCFCESDFILPNVSSADAKTIELLQEITEKLYRIGCTKQKNNANVKRLKSAISNTKINMINIKKELLSKLKNVREKCDKMCRINEESSAILSEILQKKSEYEETTELNSKITNLKAVVRARELEMAEKVKKYEINNRTLLKKAKEHMRGRNSAEKHSMYLQQLYNTALNENSTLKLENASLNCELDKLRTELSGLHSFNEKLQGSLFELEKEFARVDMEKIATEDHLNQAEMQVNELGKQLEVYRTAIQAKERICEQVQQFKVLNAELTNMNTKNIEKIQNLEQTIAKSDVLFTEMQTNLSEKETELSQTLDSLKSVKYQLEQSEEKNGFLSKEIDTFTNMLQQKEDQIERLQAQYDMNELQFSKKETNFQSIIIALRSEVRLLENELNSIKNDKYFLQRLSNDLKYALQSSVNQNKVLKERIVALSTENREFSSLPSLISSFPSPSKYDDTYINKLLERSLSLPKPLTQVQGCLNSLKKELNHLQRQVSEKKFCG